MSRRTKKERHQEAVERQKKYDSLNLKEKIDLAKSRRGESSKEITRLKQKQGEK
tara:strand:+ start:44 stop:205 length:162 start_codon:yes stop_codon:yes gene_type:complete